MASSEWVGVLEEQQCRRKENTLLFWSKTTMCPPWSCATSMLKLYMEDRTICSPRYERHTGLPTITLLHERFCLTVWLAERTDLGPVSKKWLTCDGLTTILKCWPWLLWPFWGKKAPLFYLKMMPYHIEKVWHHLYLHDHNRAVHLEVACSLTTDSCINASESFCVVEVRHNT